MEHLRLLQSRIRRRIFGYSECRPSIPERHPHEAFAGMFCLEIEVAEILGKYVHILPDFIGCDSCVNLGRLNVGMAEHL